ncbi:MAG: NAD(P)/FAD-dependent oxidoreductase [Gemmatimonadetes bacterium]|nr:NAD(P)/FAD-dependent oxidoreductase [Gemmatimonadota bacterium]
MTVPGNRSAPRSARVLIIGTGFAGIGMAIRLRERGITDVVILERAADLGGTWRDNRYPGCACDVESTLYSFSFAPNPGWTRTFSPQPEIQAYLRRVADDHGITPLIRFNDAVDGARWDEPAQEWVVTSTSGLWRAQHLVMANGALSDPSVPPLPGLDQFTGASFHTAQWDAEVPLDGRRVAVIGTGASAIQVIPAIQPRVARLIVLQRTPAWVLPRHDRAVPAWRRALYARVPFTQRIARGALHAWHEMMFLPFRHPLPRRLVQAAVGWHLAAQVRDPQLRRALRPTYGVGCKRLLLSDDYYPALVRPNVEVVTSAVERIGAHAITTADGRTHGIDVLILATGFRVTDPILAPTIIGRNGRSLADAWQGSPKAYMGTTVAGFPNLFMLAGPNTGLGHSSVVLMAEAQIEHVLGVLALAESRHVRAVEPRADAQARYVAWIDASHATTVWNAGGCRSWYLDRTGRNSTLWPFGVDRFRRLAARVAADDYLTA